MNAPGPERLGRPGAAGQDGCLAVDGKGARSSGSGVTDRLFDAGCRCRRRSTAKVRSIAAGGAGPRYGAPTSPGVSATASWRAFYKDQLRRERRFRSVHTRRSVRGYASDVAVLSGVGPERTQRDDVVSGRCRGFHARGILMQAGRQRFGRNGWAAPARVRCISGAARRATAAGRDCRGRSPGH